MYYVWGMPKFSLSRKHKKKFIRISIDKKDKGLAGLVWSN